MGPRARSTALASQATPNLDPPTLGLARARPSRVCQAPEKRETVTRRTDEQISRGFNAGNYANAYETTDYDRALASLSMNRSAAYKAAFTLGFFGSYEPHEMGSHLEAVQEAWALVGKRAKEIGIATDEPIDVRGDETHTRLSYGQMPDRDTFRRAFEARCPEGTFSFGNDPYVGTDALDERQLWRELETQHATWEEGEHGPECPGDGECTNNGGQDCPSEAAGDWCSSVLGLLGFEWI